VCALFFRKKISLEKKKYLLPFFCVLSLVCVSLKPNGVNEKNHLCQSSN
jgi:hypothetical protein